jgi:hypothetical protein
LRLNFAYFPSLRSPPFGSMQIFYSTYIDDMHVEWPKKFVSFNENFLKWIYFWAFYVNILWDDFWLLRIFKKLFIKFFNDKFDAHFYLSFKFLHFDDLFYLVILKDAIFTVIRTNQIWK